MAVPWLKIVQWVPSVLDVSRELLRKTQTEEPPAVVQGPDRLSLRVVALEDNERRQAELVARMAEQLAQLGDAVTFLHRRAQMLMAVASAACVLAVIALAVAIWK